MKKKYAWHTFVARYEKATLQQIKTDLNAVYTHISKSVNVIDWPYFSKLLKFIGLYHEKHNNIRHKVKEAHYGVVTAGSGCYLN